VEVIDRIIANDNRTKNLELLDDLCELMTDGSLCALGGLIPLPVMSAIRNFPEDFDKPAPAPPTLIDPQNRETRPWH
jgi:formate dehydrogenase iron-sulfur subunit